MADHDFNFICILFICTLNNVFNVNGDATLCVEPPLGHNYSPPPFNESPKGPFYGGSDIQPQVIPEYPKNPEQQFYEGLNIQPRDPKTPKEPFYEGPNIQPQVVPDPLINDDPGPTCKEGIPINVKYETKSPGGLLGIKFSYDTGIDKLMNVMISYDTQSAPAATFFKKQFTPSLFQRFTQCGVIKWDIVPCSKSKMKGGDLWCPNSNQNCEFDKIHACVATIYKADQQKVGTFVICFFTQGNNAQECATKSGLNYDIVWKCASGDEGAHDCDECYRHIYDIKPPRKHIGLHPMTPGISDPVDGGGIITSPGGWNPGDVVGTPESIDSIGDHGVVTPSTSNSMQDDQFQKHPSNPYVVKGSLHGNTNNPTGSNGTQKDSNLNAIVDFKGALCAKLIEGKLKCDFCSS